MTALRTRRGNVQAGGSLYALCSIGCLRLLTACLAFLLRTWQHDLHDSSLM